jgi:NAD(P)H-hydrate epimerase
MLEAEQEAAKMGVPAEMLMENAGRAVADEVLRRYAPTELDMVVVVAGSGNNGGDGFVAARYLASAGLKVSVIVLAPPERIKEGIARLNFEMLSGTGAVIQVAGDIATLRRFSGAFEMAKIIVVAILGTGIKGVVREPMAEAIRMVNRSRAVKVAVDIPAGLDPLTGSPADQVVRANLTITFHKAKVGLKDKNEFTGEVLVVPIGIPE